MLQCYSSLTVTVVHLGPNHLFIVLFLQRNVNDYLQNVIRY